MTNLEIAKDQLELALQEIKNTLTVEQGELIHDYVFEALERVKNCSMPDVVGQSEQFYCDAEKCNNSKGEICNGYCKGLSEVPPQ